MRITTTQPQQLIIREPRFSILLFTTGQGRFMGQITLSKAKTLIDSMSIIYSSIESPLTNVSQTVVFQLSSMYVPVNLYAFKTYFHLESKIQFEPERFPSVTLHFWDPLHVNIFSSGKVIVLGYNACAYIQTIRDFLEFHLLIIL